MKIEYIRQLQTSYMRIELDEPLSQTEKEMLVHNRLAGLLPVSWQQEDNKTLLRYDITGKQALDKMLEEKKADEKLLLLLLSGIYSAIKEMERYLLSQNALLLQAEGIFYDYKKEELFFCFYPSSDDIQERLLRFMEYMLAKTDHTDKEAVALAYGIYEELLKPAYSLNDIQEFMKRHRQRQREVMVQLEMETEELAQKVEPEIKREKGHLESWYEEWKEYLRSKMSAWIDPLRKKWIQRKKVEAIVFEPEDAEEPLFGLPTELLAVGSLEIQGVLRYEGSQALEDIVITKVPFSIGSAADCDGVIKAAGISRQHARIDKIEDTYFIEDLNSTNGTKVEGGLVSYKAKVSLKKNMQVQFANQPFRFQ